MKELINVCVNFFETLTVTLYNLLFQSAAEAEQTSGINLNVAK